VETSSSLNLTNGTRPATIQYIINDISPAGIPIIKFNDYYPNASNEYSISYELITNKVESKGASLMIYPYDTELFNFNSTAMSFAVQTYNLSKQGNYTMEVRARYSFTQSFNSGRAYTIKVLHPCVRNNIGPSKIDMDKTRTEDIASMQEEKFEYIIGSPA
jgi:hypothetical protein